MEDKTDRVKAFLQAHKKEIDFRKELVEIDLQKLKEFDFELYDLFFNSPDEVLGAFQEGINDLGFGIKNISPVNLGCDYKSIGLIRQKDLDKLFIVKGIVKRMTKIIPRVSHIDFKCSSCGTSIYIDQNKKKRTVPHYCSCGNKKGFKVKKEHFKDIQEINLEELPEQLEGRQPRQLRVYLEEELTDPTFSNKLQPGKRIEIIGIIMKLPVFMTLEDKESNLTDFMMHAKTIIHLEEDSIDITEEDKKQIQEIAVDKPLEKLAQSLAPEIYGNEDVKKAIVLQLVKGVAKEKSDGNLSREDIHILLVGEPGIAKSQTLKSTQSRTPRARMVVGTKTSKVGLTAMVEKDELTNSWSLSAGPLVLSSGSILMLDEIEKMNKEHINDLLEPMASGSITVARAGIHATLPARTCLPKGTTIECYEGLKPIEGIKKGDVVWGLNNHLKIVPSEVLGIYKHPLKKCLINIKSKLGKTLKLTDNHEVLTLSNEEIKWKPAMHLKKGDVIASIRRVPTSKIELTNLITNEWIRFPTIKCSKCNHHWNYKSKRKKPTCPVCGIRMAPIKIKTSKLYLREGLNKNDNGIFFDGIVGEDLAYVTGLIFSDGHIRESPRKSISFNNNDMNLLNKFENVFKKMGLHSSKTIREDKKNKSYTISGKAITFLIKKIIQKMPTFSKNLINSFVCGVIDGDGHVRRGQFQIFTATKKDTSFLRMLLLKLGIKSHTNLIPSGRRFCIDHFVQAKDFYSLAIYGVENCKKLKNRLLSIHKKNNLKITQSLEYNGGQHLDFIRVRDRFRKFRRKLGITKKQLGTNLSNKERNFTRTSLQKYLKKIKSLKNISETSLEDLAYSDIIWDEIKEIKTEKEDYVYDIQTTTKNFIAEDIVVHNSILGAANPKEGNFNPDKPLAGQIDLPSPILNRFDLIFILKDTPDEEFDRAAIRHVFKTHSDKHEAPISIELFRKYIHYCRNLKPKLNKDLGPSIEKFYLRLRDIARRSEVRVVPINLRNIEGIIRLSEAHAKLRLSETVEEEDLKVAQDVLILCLNQLGRDTESGAYDLSRMSEKVPVSKRGKLERVVEIIRVLTEKLGQLVPLHELLKEADKSEIKKYDVETFIEELKKEGRAFEPRRGFIQLI